MLKVESPRRVSWWTAARANRKAGFSPKTLYHKRQQDITPAVVTPKGSSFPYRLKRLPGGELAFTKTVKASRHFLRRPPAIALDKKALDWAEREGVSVVCVTDTETQTTYRATLALLREKGFSLDRGFGKQVALPLSRWSKEDPAQPSLLGEAPDG